MPDNTQVSKNWQIRTELDLEGLPSISIDFLSPSEWFNCFRILFTLPSPRCDNDIRDTVNTNTAKNKDWFDERILIIYPICVLLYMRSNTNLTVP
jgi:hypothetical protein